MHQYKSTLVYGLAIFAMFFGSGNLVFPIQIGYFTGSNWLLGFLGLFITGILLPFLGLFVIKIHRGSYNSFFYEAGSFIGILMPFIILSLLGSFAVVPRCITVAHSNMAYIFPELSLTLFSFVFCLVVFCFCLKDKIMMSILGKWMSPVLLIILIILIMLGIIKADLPKIESNTAFLDGFLIGYQTMDLFAAFFFSSLVFGQIQNKLPITTDYKTIIKIAIKPSILGASLLAIIYLGFVFLGSHYSNILTNIAPELMLSTIANHLMGSSSTLFIAIITIFSCLTTAIALNNIYARYIVNLVAIKDNKYSIVLFCTTAISFLISLLDFQGIARFLAPILHITYPGLIALTILSILFRGHKKIKTYIFYAISAIMIAKMII